MSVRPGTTIVAPRRLKLGRNCHFGTNCFLDARGGLEIGDGTIFANDVKVLTYNHNLKDRTRIPYDHRIDTKTVRIARGCWLGQSVLVAPGTEIGEGSVAGIGTMVVGKVGAHTLVVGNPCRAVRQLDNAERIYRLNGRRTSLLNVMRYVKLRNI